MKTWLPLAAVLALFLSPLLLWADIKPSKPPVRPPIKEPPVAKERSAPLVIEVAGDDASTRIQIPRKLLTGRRAALDTDTEDGVGALPRLNTIVAGFSLALALAFGGLWLARRGGSARHLILLIGASACLAVGGAVVWANAALPDFSKRAPMPPADKVILEVIDQGDAVKLTISKAKLAKLMENGDAKEKDKK